MGYYDNDDLTPLVGRAVNAVLVSETYLRFLTDKGPVTFQVDGDCCSWSYFYSFTGLRGLIGATVTELKYVELPEPNDEDSSHGDCVAAYGYEIETDRGFKAAFSYRNDSNGYYGGYMMKVDAPDDLPLTLLTEDWQGNWRHEDGFRA